MKKKPGENQNNLKKTWEILRSAINSGGQSKEPISELFSNGISHTDPCNIATVLNLFFTTAPQKIANELPPPLILVILQLYLIFFLQLRLKKLQMNYHPHRNHLMFTSTIL